MWFQSASFANKGRNIKDIAGKPSSSEFQSASFANKGRNNLLDLMSLSD
ncbi:hypothetical protein LEP1GSC131_2088 [Leptospira kirschneri str. 200802841]|uniref:Uncharacterized protein n=1 Tax=Leptospira kirschneri str. 200802841 TaxID=1193047 RepID=A0A828Y7Q6_9LEPT|nr:hypothetical protein LEP1GSC131_2088 [Leptospira kirschneri str. 200802841]